MAKLDGRQRSGLPNFLHSQILVARRPKRDVAPEVLLQSPPDARQGAILGKASACPTFLDASNGLELLDGCLWANGP